MKLALPSRKRAVRWFVTLVLIVLVGLYVVLPIGAGIAVLLPFQETVGDPPEGFETVRMTTSDGVTLAAWYAPPAPERAAAIVLIHGAGGSRESVRGYATLLAGHGYGVLALDLRGHGDSEGRTNRLGWQATTDIGAAVAFLEAQPGVEHIGGMGLSMGAEALLGAASTYPQIEAIAADGATRRSLEDLIDLESERPLVRNYVQRAMYFTVEVISGEKPPSPTILESVQATEATEFLLIAAEKESLEIKFNSLFADAVGSRARLWVAPGASHTGAHRLHPAEYEQRLYAFFDETLNSAAS